MILIIEDIIVKHFKYKIFDDILLQNRIPNTA